MFCKLNNYLLFIFVSILPSTVNIKSCHFILFSILNRQKRAFPLYKIAPRKGKFLVKASEIIFLVISNSLSLENLYILKPSFWSQSVQFKTETLEKLSKQKFGWHKTILTHWNIRSRYCIHQKICRWNSRMNLMQFSVIAPQLSMRYLPPGIKFWAALCLRLSDAYQFLKLISSLGHLEGKLGFLRMLETRPWEMSAGCIEQTLGSVRREDLKVLPLRNELRLWPREALFCRQTKSHQSGSHREIPDNSLTEWYHWTW